MEETKRIYAFCNSERFGSVWRHQVGNLVSCEFRIVKFPFQEAGSWQVQLFQSLSSYIHGTIYLEQHFLTDFSFFLTITSLRNICSLLFPNCPSPHHHEIVILQIYSIRLFIYGPLEGQKPLQFLNFFHFPQESTAPAPTPRVISPLRSLYNLEIQVFRCWISLSSVLFTIIMFSCSR